MKDGKFVGNKDILKKNNHWTIIKFIVEWNICIKKTTFLKIGMFPDIGPGSGHLANCGEAFILGSRLIKISKNFKYFDCIKISHPPMWIKKPYLTCIAYYYGAGYAAGEGTKQFSKFYRLIWIIRTLLASLRDFLYPLDNMLAPSELKYNKLKYKFLISYFRILGLYDAINNKLPRKKKWN